MAAFVLPLRVSSLGSTRNITTVSPAAAANHRVLPTSRASSFFSRRDWYVDHANAPAFQYEFVIRNDTASYGFKNRYSGPPKGHVGMENIVKHSVLLTTDMKVKAEQADKAAALCNELVDWVRKEEKEIVRSINIERDPDNPAHFIFLERYVGDFGLDAHQQSPVFRGFIEEIQEMLAEPLSLHVFNEFEGGQISGALFPYGRTGEGGLDDQPMSS
eukprot:CAMPEP_0196658524 /NCGR_PEP_ID=MMETSP1086-20130531/30147_1 /TAXON_ID=77921 /ORGANISM="Cyanoptyche  gloeocystis , Strain SAG4.97" /LENGTH=215 /DNA_ID=CAMNT_0041992143 /DNA_START=56 /DNA_END=703 /DNA_ORIENTATION=-